MEILASEETLVAQFGAKTDAQREKLLGVAVDVLRDPKLRKHLGPGSGWWWMAERVLRESGDKPTPEVDARQVAEFAREREQLALDQYELDERIRQVVKRF